MEELVVNEAQTRLKPGPIPADFPSLADYNNEDKIREKLYRTSPLSDEVYCQMQLDIGYRVALAVLVGQCAKGNIKAIELFLKWRYDYQAELAAKAKPAERNVTPASFVQGPRLETTIGSEPALEQSELTRQAIDNAG
jgi:hypothetical protein